MSMVYCGIDPGTEKSGFVLFDLDSRKIVVSEEYSNEELLSLLRDNGDFRIIDPSVSMWSGLYMEIIEGQGSVVGRTTFKTCQWIGRFIEAYENNTGNIATEISRSDEKIVLCGKATYVNPKTGKRKAIGDPEMRRAVIDRFDPVGGGRTPQIGTKANQGPLYGVSGHCWQALAVLITGLENDGLWQ